MMSCRKVEMLLGAVLALGMAVPAMAADDNAPAAATKVTYAKDVAPILNENCAGCHRPGQIAPMSLLTYQEARPWAKAIKKSVTERTMPPWFAAPGHQEYGNDTSLSEAEIMTLARWADQGAPIGDAKDLPPAPTFADDNAWRIGKPDKVFVMEPFTVTDDMEDHYEWVTIKNDDPEDKWVKAVEIIPGFKEAVHHNLVFLGPAGAQPHEAERSMDLFAKWGPGNNPDIYPEGHGKLLKGNSTIMFQLHYHKTPGPGTGGVDQSKMGVIFAEKPVEHPVTTAWILDPRINIPAGASDYTAESVFRFIDSGVIFNLAPHMHLRGKSFKYVAEYPDGTSEVLLDVPRWDFNWQISYYLKEPKHVPRGTKVRAIAVYDNSENNPHNPDPTINVDWGEATTDEMMIGFMDYMYDKRKQFQRTIALPEGIAEGSLFNTAPREGRGRRGDRGERGERGERDGSAGGQ